MRYWYLLLLFAAGTQAAVQPTQSTELRHYIVGLSPYLDKNVKDETFRGLVRLLVEELPLGSSVDVYDAFQLRSITSVTLPQARAFASPKTRANQFAQSIQSIRHFLAAEPNRPTNSVLRFDGALHLPQFLDFLNQNLPNSPSRASILLLGSPLYQDAQEPAFSMVDGYYPSDGHLRASRERTIYGLRSDTNLNRSYDVYWGYFGDPWLSDLHKEKISRFWSLYLEQRSAHLICLSGDLTTVLRNVVRGPDGDDGHRSSWAIDPAQTKIEMLRTGRQVPVTDWLTRDTLPDAAPQPPTILVGPMRIGIRWPNAIDLDLYARAHSDAETLYFEHPRSLEGYYDRDHRSSPGREYEFIEFDHPVDARKVEAFVNFYAGHCPGVARGEARVEFGGRIYSAPFSLRASEGNLGRAGSDQQAFWTRIPVQEMLKISAER
jgi:hypothetical protein